MNCATCKNGKIGPKVAPFGCFMCDNDHLQCIRCNQRTAGQCGVCETRTAFVDIKFCGARYRCIGKSMGDSQQRPSAPGSRQSCANPRYRSVECASASKAPMNTISLGHEMPPHSAVQCKHHYPELKMWPTGDADLQPQQDHKTAATINDAGKPEHSNLKQSEQKVLEALQEEQFQVNQTPPIDVPENYLKISVARTSLPLAMRSPPAIAVVDSGTTADHCNGPSEKPSQVVNTHRALYHPFAHTAADSRSGRSVEPPPQFQLLTCSPSNPNERPPIRAVAKPIPARQLNISRLPLRCPESTCGRMIFVSDFSRHMANDHMTLPIVRITSGEHKNFFLDPRVVNLGVQKCIMMFFISNRITDLGSSAYKDYLPLMVMSTYIRLSELCGVPAPANTSDDSIFLVVWLTGIVPPTMPLYYCLTVWPESEQVAPPCQIVNSGKIHPLADSLSILALCRGGQVLMLSDKELKLLTRRGKEMVNMQLSVQ